MDSFSLKDVYYCDFVFSKKESANIEIEIDEAKKIEGLHVISINDFKGNNFLSLFGTKIPFMAEDKVFYAGQIIAIIASKDPLKLEEAKSLIKVTYTGEEHKIEREIYEKDFYISLSAPEEEQVFKHSFNIDFQKDFEKGELFTYTSFSNSICNIYTKTTFESAIRKNVSSILKIPKSKIKVYKQNSAPLDSYFFYPILYSVAVSLCAKILKKPVFYKIEREKIPIKSFYTPVVYEISYSNKIKKIKLEVELNLSVYEVFTEEIVRLLTVASKSFYRAERVSLLIKINKSRGFVHSILPDSILHNINFCLESAINSVSKSISMDLLSFKEENTDSEIYKRIIKKIKDKTEYLKKNISYQNQIQHRLKFLKYRGIGVALGFMLNGYSVYLEKHIRKSAEIVSFDGTKYKIKLYKNQLEDGFLPFLKFYVANQLNLLEENVEFIFREEIAFDLGFLHPERQKSYIFDLVKEHIRRIQKGDKSPFQAYKVTKKSRRNKDFLFGNLYPNFSNLGSALEMEYDIFSNFRSIKKITLILDCGKTFDPKRLKDIIKSELFEVISSIFISDFQEFGRIFSVKMEDIFNVEFEIEFLRGNDIKPLSNPLSLLFAVSYKEALMQVFENRSYSDIPFERIL